MIRKIVPFLMLILALTLMLTACGGDDTPNGSETTPSGTQNDTSTDAGTTAPTGDIALTGDTLYTIIRPEKAEEDVISACSELWKKILSLTGKSLIKINEDFVKDPEQVNNTDPEVLVGATNRPLSSELRDKLPTYLDWSITIRDTKIVISANTTQRLIEAIESFGNALEMRDGVLYYTGGTIVDSYEGYKFKNLTLCGRAISEYVITLDDNAATADSDFAETLALWLAQNTGYMPDIVKGAAPSGAGVIAISGKQGDAAAIGHGGYILKTSDAGVTFAAASIAGYTKAMEKMNELIHDGALASGIDEKLADSGESLDGKKVAFIGNSFLYYGGCVELGNQRSADKGIFWQICNSNGENVTVYDFTYGGHRLRDFTEAGDKTGGSGSPGIGKDLLAGVDLSTIDIVFISEAGENNSNFVSDVKNIMKRFTKPGVQFVYVTHSYTYLKNHGNIINALPTLRKLGVTVADWGRLVYDLIRRTVKVENSSFVYTQTTFIKNKGDTHHPNPLAGYITAQMCYSVVTGKSAVGQEYSFCRDRAFGGNTSGFDGYIAKHYNAPGNTNFVKIFESPTEMAGLQKLMDEYVEQYK